MRRHRLPRRQRRRPVELWRHAARNLLRRRPSHEWRHVVRGSTFFFFFFLFPQEVVPFFFLTSNYNPPKQKALLSAKGSSCRTFVPGTGKVLQHVSDLRAAGEAFVPHRAQRAHRAHHHKSAFSPQMSYFRFFFIQPILANVPLFLLPLADPNISPSEALPDTDPSIFHKRYLKMMRHLGEVSV